MKKIITVLILISFIGTPLTIFAQATPSVDSLSGTSPSNNNYSTTPSGSPGVNSTNSDVTSGAPKAIIVTDGAPKAAPITGPVNVGSAIGSAGTCGISQILSSGVKNFVTKSFGSVLENPLLTPVNNIPETAKNVGLNVMGGVSWDAIGYCLVNSVIEYIGHATVQWINSGFNGSPVFVDDPGQFFQNIADIEAGQFLGEISSGYLCGPIQAPVKINLSNSYNNRTSPYDRRGSCTFSGISGNLDQFISGDSFSWVDMVSYSRPQNNTYGATVLGEIELNRRLANAIGTESKLLDWGRGFLSFKDPETGKISSPGSLIQEQINDRLGSAGRRLEVADEFDEIVNALVNQLIKIAINEVTQATRN